MRNKTEKEKEATRLYNKVVKVSMTEIQIGDKCQISLCKINGTKYISQSSINLLPYFIGRLLEKGTLQQSDLIHVFYKSRVITLIRTEIVEDFRNEFLTLVKERDFFESLQHTKKMYEIIADTNISVCENTISDEEIKQSEDDYYRRIALLKEISEERRAEKITNYKAESTTQQETLEQLVEKIEARGWEVTLRRKN